MKNNEKNSAFMKAENIANGNGKISDRPAKNFSDTVGENDFGKIEKYKAQAAKKRYRLKKKAELKEQRKYLKEEKDRLKKARAANAYKERSLKGGYLAAVVALSLSTLILASVLTFTAITPKESDSALENEYRRSFYNTVEQVNSMDLDLSKALASKSEDAVQSYLMNIAVNSELAENNIQQLPMEDQSRFYTAKIINQVGDFAKYLNKKIINGEGFSAKDRENMTELYKANAALKRAMQNAMANIGDDYEFKNMSKEFDGNTLLTEFNELQELSASYPELIYDGPFSDGQNGEFSGENDTALKNGENISESHAVKIFRELFKKYGVTKAVSNGLTDGEPKCYAIKGEINGSLAYANITVNGGRLIMYSYKGSCGGVEYDEAAAKTEAENFLTAAGYKDLVPVWTNIDNNLYTINYAPEINGAIIYPDLIKVRVCAETAMVIGIEATSFYKNHKQRTAETPSISKSEARKFVSEDLEVTSARLAIVPYGQKAERLCYEFTGTKDDEIYYVYIDAQNGRQIEMFKVINSEQGKLLM